MRRLRRIANFRLAVQVLDDEPGLEFIQAHQSADDQVVRAVVAVIRSFARKQTRVEQDLLLAIGRAAELGTGRFTATRAARDCRLAVDIARQCKRDATQSLNALGDRAHQFRLLFIMRSLKSCG
jgi:hypothetical protein